MYIPFTNEYDKHIMHKKQEMYTVCMIKHIINTRNHIITNIADTVCFRC